jgi:two-component system LytT family response regulator
MRLRTVIIDDEPDSVQLLKLQLTQCCPQVEIVETFTNAVKALDKIEKLQPDILFLDVEMPVISGFELLARLSHLDFGVIFITAYNQYALKAFRVNALDYLVKPIDSNELIEAVEKAVKKVKPTSMQLNQLQKQMKGEKATRIALPGQNGISFIELDEIVFVEASNNYSKLVLTDKKAFTISKTLKDVQDVLEESHFLRVHRQYIINLNHLKYFNRNKSLLIMDNGMDLPIAKNQKERLIEKYGWF